MNTPAKEETDISNTSNTVYSKEQLQTKFEELSVDDLLNIVSIHHNFRITPLSEGAQITIGEKVTANGFELHVQIPVGKKMVYKLVSFHTDLMGLARKGMAKLINKGYILPEALFSYVRDEE